MGVRHLDHTSDHTSDQRSLAVAPEDPDAPCNAESAREYLAEHALTPSEVGPVGLELERHVVDLTSPAAVVSWRRLQQALDGLALPAGSRITVEPGGQLELSTPPAPDAFRAVEALRADADAVQAALAEAGLGLLSAGTDPVRGPVRIHPGTRYSAMACYFSAAGYAADAATMMCSSASLQINIEAGPVAGWASRVGQIHRLTPVLIALSACSPLLAGEHRGVRSERAAMWQRLDPPRCASFAGHGDPAGAWASFALAAPVMLVSDAATGSCEPVRERVPLFSWVTGERLIGGRRPTFADLQQHATTLFPPVRLRGFLELRLLDCVPHRWWPGLVAIVTAVLDDPVAASYAAEAAEPTVRRTADAARLAVTDPALATAARGVIAAALPATAPELRSAVQDWAELLERGRTPADLVLDRARSDGPVACLTAAELC